MEEAACRLVELDGEMLYRDSTSHLLLTIKLNLSRDDSGFVLLYLMDDVCVSTVVKFSICIPFTRSSHFAC